MRCANSESLGKYEMDQERQEIRQEQYFGGVENELKELENVVEEKNNLEKAIFDMQEKLDGINETIEEISDTLIIEASEVDGFDFSDEMQMKIDEL